jgi:glycosyltransferase involved in cell wall biosynthesis
MTRGHPNAPPSPEFAPMRMDEVEIGAPLPMLPPGRTQAGEPFAASLCLVRLHGQPLGLVEVELPPTGLPAAELAERIGAELGDELARHLREDGLPPAEVRAQGVAGADGAPSVASRRDLLTPSPSVSVVICTRNRPDSVRTTLRSILACDYPPERWEAIVVDNASEADASVGSIEKELVGAVEVRVIHEPEPGLSNARNRGLRSARNEIVVFADDDVEVDRNWLAALTGPFGRGERVGATSGLTLPGALETPVQRWTEGFGGRSRPLAVRAFDLADPPPDKPLFPFTVGDLGAGRNMAFRRDLLADLGGFDPALGPGTPAHDGDDIEALLRVLTSGHTVVHDPTAIVWHAHPERYEELEERVWGYGVGLTACLTKAVIDHPGLLVDLVRKLPRGLAFALSPSSEKNAGRQGDFPRSLARRELLGMAYGPIAYAHSRLRRRRRRSKGSSPSRVDGAAGLRLLIVSDEYPPVVGGAARNIALLAGQLSRRGHSVSVATSWQPQAPALEDDGDVRVHRIRDLTTRMRWISEDPQRHHPPPFADPEAVLRLRRLIADFEPDLVHAYGWMTASLAAALAGSSTPLLVSTHDYGNICAQFTLVRHGQACSGPAPAKCLECAASTYGAVKGAVAVGGIWAARPLLRRKTRAIHSVSRFTADMADRNLRIPGVVPVVIPNFLEAGAGEPVDEALMEELPSEPFILFVGHLRPYKGIEVLLAAYERIEDPPPMVMVGTIGPDTPDRFPAGVTVFTYVPHATVMAMWDRALFGVSPSIAPEALPSVVLEAMSKGKAVIGSEIGGYGDMIDDGVTGLLVPPGAAEPLAEAMALLGSDDELRERLGRAAAERAREFSPEAVMPQIERLYMETVERRAPR